MSQHDVPGTAPESKVEVIKRASTHLRGTLAATLASEATHFADDDAILLKFHGSYQQDDRDTRRLRERAGEERAYSFMVRVALPAGVLSAAQYLAFDQIAGQFADGTLRVTTRQGFQFHGVLKGDLKRSVADVNAALATTLSACGDVNRNVLGCPAERGGAAETVRTLAAGIAEALRPATRAYHEIWLDGEKQIDTAPEEPFYGTQYLPRKFKAAVALDTDNCTDVYAQCLGLVAVTRGATVLGFNVLVGGGLGMTHNKGDTLARLADPLVFVAPEHAVAAARLVAAIYRDHGNRSERRHARLKYLIAERGIDWFRTEFAARADFPFAPPAPLPPTVHHDHLDPEQQPDGRWSLGVFVQSGRIGDRAAGPLLRAGLHEAIARWQPEVRLTAQQNVLFVNLTTAQYRGIDEVLREHRIVPTVEIAPVRRGSMACPALPTCGLAVAESERAMPALLASLEAEIETLGVHETPLTVRMTGCPNGCARPYTADLAFVGRTLGKYQVYVGGRLAGDRMADLFLAEVPEDELVPAIRPLLQRWATERRAKEGLGDFYQRVAGRTENRRQITGREVPSGAVRLPVLDA